MGYTGFERLWLFFAFSFFGWVLETAMAAVRKAGQNMNRRQRKKKKAQVFTIILGCTAFCKAEQYEKMRKSVEYQLRTGSVVMLPAYLHVEAIIKQRGGRNIEIKQENGVVNV